jgi:Serine/threonine protein kinase
LAGRYKLIDNICQRCMAIVYKTRCRLLNRNVSITILRPEFTTDDQFIEYFMRESQAPTPLRQPNIVSVYDVCKEVHIHFIVMELVEGKTLTQYIEQKGLLDYEEVISITRQVATPLNLALKIRSYTGTSCRKYSNL